MFWFIKRKIKLRLEKLIKYSEPNKNQNSCLARGVFSGYSYLEILEFKKYLKNFNQNHLIIFGINKIDRNKKILQQFNSSK